MFGGYGSGYGGFGFGGFFDDDDDLQGMREGLRAKAVLLSGGEDKLASEWMRLSMQANGANVTEQLGYACPGCCPPTRVWCAATDLSHKRCLFWLLILLHSI